MPNPKHEPNFIEFGRYRIEGKDAAIIFVLAILVIFIAGIAVGAAF